MEALRNEALVESDTLTFETVADDSTGLIVRIRLSGEVRCYSGLRLRVLKWMGVRGSGRALQVRTDFYQYHAWAPPPGRPGERSVLRYDQAHGGTPHRHEYNADGDQVAYEELTLETMPRLDTVVREASVIFASFPTSPG